MIIAAEKPCKCISMFINKITCTKIPESPPTSIFFKFFASSMTIVSFPEFGTYRREKHMSPSCEYTIMKMY